MSSMCTPPSVGRAHSYAGDVTMGHVTRRDLPPRVPVTALRVFEPLDAFPLELRQALSALVADPSAARGVEEAERLAAWLRVLGRRDQDDAVRARVLRVEGSVLLSPLPSEPEDGWSPRLFGSTGVPGAFGATGTRAGAGDASAGDAGSGRRARPGPAAASSAGAS